MALRFQKEHGLASTDQYELTQCLGIGDSNCHHLSMLGLKYGCTMLCGIIYTVQKNGGDEPWSTALPILITWPTESAGPRAITSHCPCDHQQQQSGSCYSRRLRARIHQ